MLHQSLRFRRAALPLCRDPFVNTPLLALRGAPGVPARFWTSTWNSHTGCQAALVDEFGDYRRYDFHQPKHNGFYSAAQEDANTLWLCGDLGRVVRLDLPSGTYEAFPTGAPGALVFQGMILDEPTGKLFFAAFPPPRTVAVAYDIRARRTARIVEDAAPDHYARVAFRHPDGTWSLVMENPGLSLLRWDPRTDEVTSQRLLAETDIHAAAPPYSLIFDGDGRPYFPGLGWYDPDRRTIAADGPRPQRECTWFARRDGFAYGAAQRQSLLTISRWNLATGEVEETMAIDDCTSHGVNATADGKLIVVSIFGEFQRRDLDSGALEIGRRLPATSIQHTDCVQWLGDERLLGTPFITQRFWEVNLATGEGRDCGRAASGPGEILRTWRLNGKVYMAAYANGALVEYDPMEHPHFPENPHTVAAPPHCMRPVADTTDGQCLYYACSPHYGHLGSTVVGYDTATGRSWHVHNPLPDQQIVGLAWLPQPPRLLATTSIHADCQSCPPKAARACFAVLDAITFTPIFTLDAPAGAERAILVGPLGADGWLVHCPGVTPAWLELRLDGHRLTCSPLADPPDDGYDLRYAGRPGHFLIRREDRVELRALPGNRRLAVVAQDAAIAAVRVTESALCLIRGEDVLVADDFLAALTP